MTYQDAANSNITVIDTTLEYVETWNVTLNRWQHCGWNEVVRDPESDTPTLYEVEIHLEEQGMQFILETEIMPED